MSKPVGNILLPIAFVLGCLFAISVALFYPVTLRMPVSVGILGVCPFAALILMVIVNIGKSLRQIRKSGTTLSPLVPIVGVLIAGLVNAGFEDWLFAMGYYLCIVFWGLAFVLVDYVTLPERGRNLSPGLAIAASASSIPL
jgi:hypothetical protein